MLETKEDKELVLTEKERNLIIELRKLPFGETHVVVYKRQGELDWIDIERVKETKKL